MNTIYKRKIWIPYLQLEFTLLNQINTYPKIQNHDTITTFIWNFELIYFPKPIHVFPVSFLQTCLIVMNQMECLSVIFKFQHNFVETCLTCKDLSNHMLQ